MGDQDKTNNDTFCSQQTPPRLTFQAHMVNYSVIVSLHYPMVCYEY